jgi:hypothetical protein
VQKATPLMYGKIFNNGLYLIKLNKDIQNLSLN